MKQAQNARKQRARSAPRKGGGRSNNNSGSNAGNRNDNRARGNPKQQLEKYKNQARDALTAGDRVDAEYYFQFADHYQRVVNEMQENSDRRDQKEQSADESRQEGRQEGRQRHQQRNRRGHNNQDHTEDNNAQADKKNTQPDDTVVAPSSDISASDQPREVHPELDLGAAAPVADAEKPKRRAPARRKPVKQADAEGAKASATDASKDTSSEETVPKPRAPRRPRKAKVDTDAPAPTDDEAAA